MRVIGVMSGTSCDGVDAVLLDLTGPNVRHTPTVVAHAFLPYDAALARELASPETLTIARVAELGFSLPRLYAECIRALPGFETAEVCGCHGQTVWHAPPSRGSERPCTLSLGSTSVLAELIGVSVVGELRAADIVAGGEGAPIAPIAHYFFTPPANAGRLVVNIGGIANVTFVGESLDEVRAADVGPGMMIVDALARRFSSDVLSCDLDGQLSRDGTSSDEVVSHVLGHPFFARPTPRTTGREDFGDAYASDLVARFPDVAPADLVRSAIVVTAECIARAARAHATTEVLLTGGGAKNPTLALEVRARVSTTPVVVAEEGVFAPSHHEPAAMALIAARTLHGLTSNLPRVTGAAKRVVLGHVARPTPRPHR